MTREDIIKLAMEYGFTGSFDDRGNLTYDATFVEAVTEAVYREREMCAKLCDARAIEYDGFTEEQNASEKLAQAIRAMGNK